MRIATKSFTIWDVEKRLHDLMGKVVVQEFLILLENHHKKEQE